MRFFLCLSLFSVLIVGCNSGSATQKNAESEKKTKHDHEHDEPVEPEIEVRESIEGRWMFSLAREMAAYPLAIVNVTKDGDTRRVESAPSEKIKGAPKFVSGSATDKTVELVFTIDNTELKYNGQLKDDGIVRGTVSLGPGGNELGIMLPTALEALGSNQPKPLPRLSVYQQVPQAEKQHEALLKFAEENPQHALAIDAYKRWLLYAKSEKFTESQIEETVGLYREAARRWGDGVEQFVPFHVATALSNIGYLPGLSSKYLDDFKATMPEDATDELKRQVQLIQDTVKFARNLAYLKSDDEEKQNEAISGLKENLDLNPMNGQATLALATYYRKKPDPDNAIEYLARLVSIPNLEKMVIPEMMEDDPQASLPSQQLTELWVEKHGSTAGLDDRLTQVYRSTFNSFIKDENKFTPRKPGEENQVVLLELFTGAQCAPCVAADLTTDILTNGYQESELIVLRYHEHVPGADPLANRDSHKRASFYNLQGTPSMLLNGREVQGIGGSITQVPAVFNALARLVTAAIHDKSDGDFKLSAIRDGESVQINAMVENIDDTDGGEYYLRIALVESDIRYKAPNGIRLHDMVVRKMLGGIDGFEIVDGKAEFSETISIDGLKESLITELDMFEQYKNTSVPVRPMALSKLRLVAFVQEDGDRRIIQANVTDVMTPDEAAKAEAQAAARKAEKSAKDEPNEGQKTPGSKPDEPEKSEAPDSDEEQKESDTDKNEKADEATKEESEPKKEPTEKSS